MTTTKKKEFTNKKTEMGTGNKITKVVAEVNSLSSFFFSDFYFSVGIDFDVLWTKQMSAMKYKFVIINSA